MCKTAFTKFEGFHCGLIMKKFLVAVAKHFVEIMLHFHWLKSPWRRGNIFRYSLLSRMVVLFVNIGEPEKLKRNYESLFIKYTCFKNYISIPKWRNVIAKWSHCKVTSFFLISNSSLFVSHENSNKFLSLWLTYPGNKYNNNYFFDLYREYCPQSSHRPRRLGRYVVLKQYLPVHIKTSYYCINITLIFNASKNVISKRVFRPQSIIYGVA